MMPDNAAPTERKSIVVDYDLPHSPEKVWRALTEPALLERWLMPNDIAPVVGHRFTFRTQPAPNFDGIVHCEVLEVLALKRLRYSWQGGNKELAGYGHWLDTVVTWTLTETETGTHLRLEHDGFAPKAFAYEPLSKGWRGHVAERMSEILNEAD
ncbi:SRPBCC domain-containing protein [Parvibaculum sp.]|uniref:SRPBCC family protein n=1 Tax=Parvibaculum sp. TaxID=2024848 RepID=UPI002CB49D94|nr:SRPBCC domain-containing protein [Parvibaculum sp.]HUD53575.1 SRPBCC domain-containing protein [Parvibaculum sp.]